MNLFLWNILLAFIYAAVSDSFTPATMVFGFILGYFVLFISTRNARSKKYFHGLDDLIRFVFFYLKEFLLAALRVAYDVLTPGNHMRPGIVAIPLDAKTDGEIGLLANLITLTPGGISLEVSHDRKVLYIYEMYLPEDRDFVQEVKKGLERRVLEVMGS